MKLFDLHCDTITECCRQKRELYKNDGHIDLCKAKSLDRWAQVFAIWMPDEHRGAAAVEYFDEVYKCFCSEMNKNSLYIKQCRTVEEIESCFDKGKNAAILSVEGASALAGDIGRLEYMNSIGVKLITLTWNAENELAYGCVEKEDIGLKPFGKSVIREMNRLKMIVDVSHIGKKSFWDVANETDVPFIASHSTSASVLENTRAEGLDKYHSVRRNLDDEQIKLIISRRGLIGLNFCNSFLGDKGDDGYEAAYRHLCRFLELGGEDCLAIGGDFDGCNLNPEFCGIDRMTDFEEYLLKSGINKAVCDKIFFNNALNFFKCML